MDVVHEVPAGRVLVDRLIALGVDQVFGVPGESYLALLEALRERSDLITYTSSRHEGGAAMMAVGHAKASGRPGVCLVSRGPGATNASIGVHVARQDAVPLVVIVGHVPRGERDREALQEVRHERVFGELAKAAYEVVDPSRIDEYVLRAWHEATSGRPGPVVLSIPEDVTSAVVPEHPLTVTDLAESGPTPAALERVRQRLLEAERPLMVVGGYGWDDDGRRAIVEICRRLSVPVCVTVRQQDLVDNRQQHFVGSLGLGTFPHLADAVERADLLLVVGSRLDAFSTDDYELFRATSHDPRLIHVLPDPADLNVVFPAAHAIVSHHSAFVSALSSSLDRSRPAPKSEWAESLRKQYEDRRAESRGSAAGQYVTALAERTADDTIMCAGAGSYTAWYQNSWEFTAYPSQIATQSGSMGFGLPAGIGAALANPGRAVCVWAGDGCFQMTSQELIVAKELDLDILVIVINNGLYGSIAMHQDRVYPNSRYATDIASPDFAALAASFGMRSATVSDVGQFESVLDEWAGLSAPRLIEIRV